MRDDPYRIRFYMNVIWACLMALWLLWFIWVVAT